MTCSCCGKKQDLRKPLAVGVDSVSDKKERLPKGWKRLKEAIHCDKCWDRLFVRRAVTIPVASPLDLEWPEFREILKSSWQQSTALANWTVITLAKNDVVRKPDMDKCPKMEAPYLYPLARAFMPACPSTSTNAIIRTVEAKYRKTRLETVWRHAAALPTYRYPYPFPVPAQNWSLRYLSETERVPIFTVRLQDRLVQLRLRGGPEFRRQLHVLGQLIGGSAHGCEAAIYRVTTTGNTNRNGMMERANAGGTAFQSRVMVKIVAWVPKTERKNNPEKMMVLSTAKDCFWVGILEGREPWQVNADHVRRWVVEHSRFLERIADDTKREKRIPNRMRTQIDSAVEVRCKKQNDRLSTWCHQATASAADFAVRQHVTKIELDVRCKDYLPSFPWFRLRELLIEKCAARHIEVVCVKDETEAAVDQ